jgi:SAM-dependent methyltransferase
VNSTRWADEWERFGQHDPYFGVCNLDQNRGVALSADASVAFWASGASDVAAIAVQIEELSGQAFAPQRALEFGCGVGRLTIPLAQRAREVVAVDIAPSMIERAREHTAAAGLNNVHFALSDASLSRVEGRFDFVYSFIVFQHIPPNIGYDLFRQLLGKLAPGGFGALHVTYGRRASLVRRIVHAGRCKWRIANMIVNVLQGRSARTPMMPMFEYDRRVLLQLLDAANCGHPREQATDHGGHLGAMLMFHKGAGRHS